MMRGKAGALLIILGALLVAGALGLIAYNIHDDYRAGDAAADALRQLAPQLPQDVPAAEPAISTEGESQEADAAGVYLDPTRQMPVKMIEGREYIAVLNIPVLELELPVLKVWGSENLKIAPCWYYGSVYTRDMVICAHNYTNHFGRLNLLVKGDRVDLTDMDGNVFHYRVALKEELPGSAVEEMNSGEWDLTLYTCTTGGQSRVTVRCSLVDAEEK